MDMSELPQKEKNTQLHPFLKRNLLAWAIRWTIGFSIIGWLTYQFPALQWIWLPAILVAVFSLLLLFLIHFIMKSETGFFASIRRFVQKIITGKW